LEKETNFGIGGFLAGPPRSPLIVCSFFRPSNQSLALWSPKHPAYWFSLHHQLVLSVGRVIMFCNLSFFNERLYGSDKIKGH